MIKKIAVLTSGGDSPGMNNAVRAVVKKAISKGMVPYLVYEGFKGLVNNNIVLADSKNVDQYITKGGTHIFSARLPEFSDDEVAIKGVNNLQSHGIEALIVVGGDGSYKGAKKLSGMGIKCIGLPGTIDNDISSSEFTIGFDTALNTVVDSIDKIRDTAESHARCSIVEIMGRHCPDLSIFAAIATGAEVLVTSDNPMQKEEVLKSVISARENGHRSIIVAVAEKVYPDIINTPLSELASYIQSNSGIETRATVLGHLQRGGKPTAMERILATRMAAYAIDLILDNKTGRVVGNKGLQLIDYEIDMSLDLPREKRKELIDLCNEINSK
jgi:6-phosphofructokinase 1